MEFRIDGGDRSGTLMGLNAGSRKCGRKKTRCNRTCTVAEIANRRDLSCVLVFFCCSCFSFH